MTEEIINADGSRNWEANILLDNIKRLEQENKELKETVKQHCEWLDEERESNEKLQKAYQNDHCDLINYRSVLDTIQRMVLSAWEQGKHLDGGLYNDLTKEFAKINEVL